MGQVSEGMGRETSFALRGSVEDLEFLSTISRDNMMMPCGLEPKFLVCVCVCVGKLNEKVMLILGYVRKKTANNVSSGLSHTTGSLLF